MNCNQCQIPLADDSKVAISGDRAFVECANCGHSSEFDGPAFIRHCLRAVVRPIAKMARQSQQPKGGFMDDTGRSLVIVGNGIFYEDTMQPLE